MLHGKYGRKAMCASINVENKKQNHQKPPLSRRRIAGEILAGTALGLVALLAWKHVAGTLLGGDRTDNWVGLITFFLVSLMLYGPASAVGVYLVGTIGKETGSFPLTLGGAFAGVITMCVMLPLSLEVSGVLIVGVERIVSFAVFAFVLLIPPTMATLGFNLTRRYKKPPSP